MGYFVGLENKKVEIIGYVERIKGLFDDVFIGLKWENLVLKRIIIVLDWNIWYIF